MAEVLPEGTTDDSKKSTGQPSAEEARDREIGEERERRRLAEIDAAKERGRREESEAAAARAAAEANKPKAPPLTRAQLAQAVVDEKITQEAMDAELERQLEERLSQKTDQRIAQERATAQIQAKIDAYYEKIPSLKTKAGESWDKAMGAYKELMANGSAANLATEYAALRIAFGDSKNLMADRTASERDTLETGGGGGGGHEGAGADAGAEPPPKGMPAHLVPYYRAEIAKGRYAGMKDPKLLGQVKYMNADRRRRSA